MKTRPQAASQLKAAPLIVEHRDNRTGTRVAMKLQKRAVRVAAAKRQSTSVWPPGLRRRPCGRSPPRPPLPSPRGACAGKLPMPVAPPFQMTERVTGREQYNVAMAPPPTHSPLPSLHGLRVMDADAHVPAYARRAKALSSTFSAAPTRSPRLPAKVDHVYALEASNQPSPAAVPPAVLNGNPGGTAGAGVRPDDAPVVPAAPPQAPAGAAADSLAIADSPASLRQRLERTVTPPLYGSTQGASEQQKLLDAAQQAGMLDALAARLEQEPVDVSRAAAEEVLKARLLAAVYERPGPWNGTGRAPPRRPAADGQWRGLVRPGADGSTPRKHRQRPARLRAGPARPERPYPPPTARSPAGIYPDVLRVSRQPSLSGAQESACLPACQSPPLSSIMTSGTLS